MLSGARSWISLVEHPDCYPPPRLLPWTVTGQSDRPTACPVTDRLSDQTHSYGQVEVDPGTIGGKDLGRVTAHGQGEATPIAERETCPSAQ